MTNLINKLGCYYYVDIQGWGCFYGDYLDIELWSAYDKKTDTYDKEVWHYYYNHETGNLSS